MRSLNSTQQFLVSILNELWGFSLFHSLPLHISVKIVLLMKKLQSLHNAAYVDIEKNKLWIGFGHIILLSVNAALKLKFLRIFAAQQDLEGLCKINNLYITVSNYICR